MKIFKYNSFFNLLFLLFCIQGIALSDVSLGEHKEFSFQDVIDKAKSLAEKTFQERDRNDIPESLKQIGYDQWFDIRYNPAKSLWANDPFSVQFFHRGFIFPEQVTVNYIEKNEIIAMPFSQDLYNYKKKEKYHKQIKGDIGFSGFRIHYPLNGNGPMNELISFIGASYFRALGKDLYYGLSARGLAINTVENIGEEFPFFREFWVIRPSPGAEKITVYALLDSSSLTGAYEFVIHPGEKTVMNVKSTIFIRKPVKKLGIAPLTSMFSFGENSFERRNGDFRPEVHDSDGFLMHTKSGEWIWHPLLNPNKLLINAFSDGQPAGFGLLQRDTNFDHYQDLQARYDARPSTWVEPIGDWGKGHVELFQLSTAHEYADNVGAYWVPEKSLEPGESLNYAYTLSWYSAKNSRQQQLAIADSTRIIRAKDHVMFMIDFVSDSKQTSLFKKELKAEIKVLNGYKPLKSQIIENFMTGGLRLIVNIRFDKKGFLNKVVPNVLPDVNICAFIKHKNKPVTETWSYSYQP